MSFTINQRLAQLLKRKQSTDYKIKMLLAENGFDRFSVKKFVGDLGEYYAMLYLDQFFGKIEIQKQNNAEFDLLGINPNKKIKTELNDEPVKIEVKTRYHQKGNPQIFGLHPKKFHLLAFVSLNEDYSVHYVGIVKSDIVKPDNQNRIKFKDYEKHTIVETAKFEPH